MAVTTNIQIYYQTILLLPEKPSLKLLCKTFGKSVNEDFLIIADSQQVTR